MKHSIHLSSTCSKQVTSNYDLSSALKFFMAGLLCRGTIQESNTMEYAMDKKTKNKTIWRENEVEIMENIPASLTFGENEVRHFQHDELEIKETL